MQYQMIFKLFLIVFLSSVLSCRQINNKKDEIIVPKVTILPLKQDYKISWVGSSMVQFNLSQVSYTYPKIDYDSAKILYYWGYNLEEGLDTISYFPLNQ